MILPIPIPEGPYTLRALSTFLEQLTAYYLGQDEAGQAYDFRRSVQLLHRVASHYHRITGIDFERIPGRRSELLSFTREQFELFALVVYRSVVDGTSYEYNIRRELNLPAEGYGLLTGRDQLSARAEAGAGANTGGTWGAVTGDTAEMVRLRQQVGWQAEQLSELHSVVEKLQEQQRLTYATVAVLMELMDVDMTELEGRLKDLQESLNLDDDD